MRTPAFAGIVLVTLLLAAQPASAIAYTHTYSLTAPNYSTWLTGGGPCPFPKTWNFAGSEPKNTWANVGGVSTLIGTTDNTAGYRTWTYSCAGPITALEVSGDYSAGYTIPVGLPVNIAITWYNSNIAAYGGASTMNCVLAGAPATPPTYDLVGAKCTWQVTLLPGATTLTFSGHATKTGLSLASPAPSVAVKVLIADASSPPPNSGVFYSIYQ